MPKTNDIVQDVYSLIDEDRFEEAEEQLEYMTTSELTSLFNYLTTVCPNNRLMKVVEEEIQEPEDVRDLPVFIFLSLFIH